MVEKDISELSSSVRILHSPHGRAAGNNVDGRVRELETENQRLQLLVAELLIKNQQLRKMAQNP